MARASKESTVVVGSVTGLAACDDCQFGTANRVHGRPVHAWCAAGLSVAAWWDRLAAKRNKKRRRDEEPVVTAADLEGDGPIYKDKGADFHDATNLPRKPESRARRALDPPLADGTFSRPVYPGLKDTFLDEAYGRLDELSAAAAEAEAPDAA